MTMDPSREDLWFLNGFELEELFQDVLPILPAPPPPAPPVPASSFPNGASAPSASDASEDCEIQSDTILNFISQMLMDEDMEARTCMYQECSALQAAEKPFYDILGKKYPPSNDHHPHHHGDSPETLDEVSSCTVDQSHDQSCCSHVCGDINIHNGCNWIYDHVDCVHQTELVSPVSTLSINHSTPSSFDSPEASVVERRHTVQVGNIAFPAIFDKSQKIPHQRELEEPKDFFPIVSFGLQMNGKPGESEREFTHSLPDNSFVNQLESNGSPLISKHPVTESLPNGNYVINLKSNGLAQMSNVAVNCVLRNCVGDRTNNDSSEDSNLGSNGSTQISKGASDCIHGSYVLVDITSDNSQQELTKNATQCLHNSKSAHSMGTNPDLTESLLQGNMVTQSERKESLNIVGNGEAEREDGQDLLDAEPAEGDDCCEPRKHRSAHCEDTELERGRRCKHSAICYSSEIRSEIFDQVLLCKGIRCYDPATNLRETMQHINGKHVPNGNSKGSNGTRSRGKKQGKKEVVDLRAMLMHCAQVLATDDYHCANKLLQQIRQHSSPVGDGSQRLAHWFAESLEARLSGTGSQIYTALSAKRTSAAIMLKAYHLFFAACPFKKLSFYFANQTIANAAENATSLHIIHVGILYGFQWPSFIQRLSGRPGGPPKLRITGIDFPQPGFRPAERIEETGQRLSEYARMFNVPFEYRAIAAKWESIKIEDLNLVDDEVLVVNCLFRMRNLFDETVVVECPRNIVLNKIRQMKPKIFILGIENGAYSPPFFLTRFREALFHFSTLFDMLETNVPRDHPERMVIEREIFGREILNVVACEGSERVERPETYKQWQIRCRRAGLEQFPLKKEIKTKIRDKVKEIYHKDFVVDEDSGWLLQGWKGRVTQALSTWVPAKE